MSAQPSTSLARPYNVYNASAYFKSEPSDCLSHCTGSGAKFYSGVSWPKRGLFVAASQSSKSVSHGNNPLRPGAKGGAGRYFTVRTPRCLAHT